MTTLCSQWNNFEGVQISGLNYEVEILSNTMRLS